MFQLLTDIASDLSFKYLNENNVGYVGFTVSVDGCEYHTDIEGEISPEYLLELINEGKEPITSQVNVGRFVEFFKEYAKNNMPVLYLAFSSGLSGTYQSALQAVEILKEKYPNAMLTVVDTKAAANGMAVLVERAVQMRDNGATLEQVVEMVDDIGPRILSWVTVDDLHHLERGGRISKVTAIFGTMLNIKPIIDVDANGRLRQVEKTRGRTKALKYLVDKTLENIDSSIKQKIFIGYSGDISNAHKVKKMIEEASNIIEFEINPLGPTIVSHTGDGTIAVFSISKEPRK